jgi:hypothetical protein
MLRNCFLSLCAIRQDMIPVYLFGGNGQYYMACYHEPALIYSHAITSQHSYIHMHQKG